MPNKDFYSSLSYPTMADYVNPENEKGLAIIDEVRYESNFLTHAMMKPTNDGMRERFTRKSELYHRPYVMSLDEHYTPSSIKTGDTQNEFGTMRIGDRIQWETRQSVYVSQEDKARQREREMRKAIDSMVDMKQERMLYARSQEDDNISTEEAGKSIPGLFSKLENIYTLDDINTLYDHLERRENPFENVGEHLVTLSNYSSTRTQADTSKYYEENDVWTSIIGVAFGEEGVITVFPSAIKGNAGGGFSMDFKSDIEARDNEGKYYTYDRVNFEAYFGIGVLNRYCLLGLRNIFLGHSKKNAIFEEMESVEDNLIELKDLFDAGQTGYSMAFYCSPRLVKQMEKYQKEKYPAYQAVTGSREFDGKNPRKRPKSIQITSDITLFSDPCFLTNEKFISGKISDVCTL